MNTLYEDSIYDKMNKIDDNESLSQKDNRIITESFTKVGTYKYRYIPIEYDEEEYENVDVTEDEFYTAIESGRIFDRLWLTSNAFITKENNYYQLSWGGNDDYEEFSSIAECKNFLRTKYSYFQWINEPTSQDAHANVSIDREGAKRISAKLTNVRKEIKHTVSKLFDLVKFRKHMESFDSDIYAFYATDWGKKIENSPTQRNFHTLLPHEGETPAIPLCLDVIIKEEMETNDSIVEDIIGIVNSMTDVFKNPKISTLTNPDRTILKFYLKDEIIDKINNTALFNNGLQLVQNRVVEI